MAIDQSREVNAVSAAVEALRKAMIAADGSSLGKLTAGELSYGHSNGRIENKAEFIETLTSGKSEFSAIELSDQTVNVVDNIGIVRHVFVGSTGKTPGGAGQVKLAILTVWLQQQEQWKLLARQAAKL